jgi:hypothetical protein
MLNRIDPDAWRPMIMSFQQLYRLKQGEDFEFETGGNRRGALSGVDGAPSYIIVQLNDFG